MIRGSAVNNDGVRKVGYTAPGLTGQRRRDSPRPSAAPSVSADTIDYVEAHGTATPLGDAVELDALIRAFARATDRKQFCALGSVKANIGHLDRAAGVAGLIKTALALHHAQLPPQIEFSKPAPDSDLNQSPFYINTQLKPWPDNGHPRRAGVSAFGLGGTNAHVVLEEAPTPTPSPASGRSQELLVVSAKSEAALEEACSRLASHLRAHPEQPLADVAHTLQTGRSHFSHRRAVTAQTHSEAAAALDQPQPSDARQQTRERTVAFVMAPDVMDLAAPTTRARIQELVSSEPVFRAGLERRCALLETDVRAHMGLVGGSAQEHPPAIARVLVTLALADLWKSWVGAPKAVAGAGAGALAAATVAAAIPEAAALEMVVGGAAGVPDLSPSDAEHTPVLIGGRWLTAGEATDPAFWLDRLRDPAQPLAMASEWLATQGQVALVIGEPKPPAERLRELGDAWLAGVDVDWRGLAAGKNCRRVPLPTYPFEGRRYWIEPSARPALVAAPQRTGKRPDPADWFYVPVWRPTFDLGTNGSDGGRPPSEWLIFVEEGTLGPRLVQQLRARSRVIRVRQGRRFERVKEDEFTIDSGRHDDYTSLLAALDRPPQAILFLWSLEVPSDGGLEEFEQAQETGFYSLLNVVKALAERSMTHDLRLWAVTRNVQSVTRTEEIRPEGATVAGALKVIAQENLNLTTCHLDVDCPPAGTWQEQRLADLLAREVTSPREALGVAFRGNERWVEGYESVALRDRRPLRQRGVYLITGGLGRVGLTLAEHLARTVSARLVITSHRGLPPEQEWPAWLEQHGAEDVLSARILAVQRVRDAGGEVLVAEADVADSAAMAGALRLAHERFGPLNGVIHAAGASGPDAFLPIQNTERPPCQRHFSAKAGGLYVLEELCSSERLDFCVVFSSLASILGGLGFVGYSAANSFIDSFVHRHNQRSPQRWTAVNWDTWQVDDSGHGDLGRTLVEYAMTKPEAIDAFERVAGTSGAVTQLVNSTGDLDARLDQWIRQIAGQGRERRATSLHARPDLGVPYVAPRDDTEGVIVDIWEEIFGMRVGVDDPFLELGGNSLLGTRVIARLRKAFGTNLPLLLLFETPTIAQMAVAIKLALIDEIERLKEEEVMQLLHTSDPLIDRET